MCPDRTEPAHRRSGSGLRSMTVPGASGPVHRVDPRFAYGGYVEVFVAVLPGRRWWICRAGGVGRHRAAYRTAPGPSRSASGRGGAGGYPGGRAARRPPGGKSTLLEQVATSGFSALRRGFPFPSRRKLHARVLPQWSAGLAARGRLHSRREAPATGGAVR